MSIDYTRIELRIPLEWSEELEGMQKDVFERSGHRVSKSSLIRKMIETFFQEPLRTKDCKKAV